MIIGTFTKERDGSYHGSLVRYMQEHVTLTPTQATGGGQPDYVVRYADSQDEVGVAWKKTSAKGNAYLSVKLDSPFQAAPINCALVSQKLPNGLTHALVWTRDSRKADSDDAAAA